MITFADWVTFLSDSGIDTDQIQIVPGVDTDALDQPGRQIAITQAPGAPMTFENRIDNPAYQFRCIGDQNDYSDAEKLAAQVDAILLGVYTTTQVGAASVKNVNRSGGGPSLLLKDDGDRYHFICTYLVQVASGL